MAPECQRCERQRKEASGTVRNAAATVRSYRRPGSTRNRLGVAWTRLTSPASEAWPEITALLYRLGAVTGTLGPNLNL